MELTTAQELLVIFLSVALAIFLVLAIVIAAMVIKLLQTLRTVTDKAERLVETAESAVKTFKNASGPLAVFKFLKNVVETVQEHKQAKNKE